jgi:hypothetical protein
MTPVRQGWIYLPWWLDRDSLSDILEQAVVVRHVDIPHERRTAFLIEHPDLILTESTSYTKYNVSLSSGGKVRFTLSGARDGRFTLGVRNEKSEQLRPDTSPNPPGRGSSGGE